MRVIYHPGGVDAPVCRECEPLFNRAKYAGGLLEDSHAHILTVFLDAERVFLEMSSAPILYKTLPYGLDNGLVQNGPWVGHWVHRIANGEWLLARPNAFTEAGVTCSSSRPFILSSALWESSRLYLQTGTPQVAASIAEEELFFDFADYFFKRGKVSL